MAEGVARTGNEGEVRVRRQRRRENVRDRNGPEERLFVADVGEGMDVWVYGMLVDGVGPM